MRGSDQLAVHLVGDGHQPLVGAVPAGYLQGQVGEPAVRGSAVPVLHAGGDLDHIARGQLPGLLTLLLAVAPTGHAEEKLSAYNLIYNAFRPLKPRLSWGCT